MQLTPVTSDENVVSADARSSAKCAPSKSAFSEHHHASVNIVVCTLHFACCKARSARRSSQGSGGALVAENAGCFAGLVCGLPPPLKWQADMRHIQQSIDLLPLFPDTWQQ